MKHTVGSVRVAGLLAVVLAVSGMGGVVGCGAKGGGATTQKVGATTLPYTGPRGVAGGVMIPAQVDWKKGRSGEEVAALVRIREEGMERSQVMDTLDYLTNVIGPRLTGSPQLKRANEWAKGKFEEWGLSEARLEQWGPFGKGWSLERYSMQVVSPDTIVLNGFPRAWSGSLNGGEVTEAEVVHIDTGAAGGGGGELDLEKWKGKLKGKVVMIGAVRVIEARWEPMATRLTEEELRKLADAPPPAPAGQGGGLTNPATRASGASGAVVSGEVMPGQARGDTAGERRAAFGETAAGRALQRSLSGGGGAAGGPATTRSSGGGATTRGGGGGGQQAGQRAFNFAVAEGAALVLTPSTRGDGGTLFVQGAQVPSAGGGGGVGGGVGGRARPWAVDGPEILPQVMLAAEDFNRLARMLARGIEVKVRAELRARYHTEDEYAYNTIAEIPGGDLADEVVMVGAHIDSWQSSTGTTDNGVGTATMMEAMRILKAAGVKPRRTIRVGLWSGEEQGLYGSAAYVKRHLGTMEGGGGGGGGGGATTRPGGGGPRKLVRLPGHEKFSVYFNMDNGTGRLRGLYTQGNLAAVKVFERWLGPVADLEARTVTVGNTGSTDHMSFDAVGLPGFQFIQDSVEYFTRTWHSNQDSYDRAQAGDLKQAATVVATLVYQAAMAEEKFPRRALPAGTLVEDGVEGVKVGQ